MKRLVMVLAMLCVPAVAMAGTNYDDTPMTASDLVLYLSVMHAAASRIAHASGDDKAAIDLWRKTHGNLASPPGNDPAVAMAWYRKHSRDVELIGRATELESCDDDIAKQRGVEERYDGIKNQVESLIMWGGTGGASCGRGDCGGARATAAQIAESKREQAARKADWQLVKPHAAEIRALVKKVRHLGGGD